MKLLHGCSPVNCQNIRRKPFLKNTSGWLFLYTWKWIQHMPTGIHLFRVKIQKLQSTKLTVKTTERQNLRRFGALMINFWQISHLNLLLLFWLWICKCWLGLIYFNLFGDVSHKIKNKQVADLGPTDHLQWSSLWQYNIRSSLWQHNIRKSFRIEKSAPT